MEFPAWFLLQTYLLRALVLMLFVANWARFFTALLGGFFKLDSFRLCVEFRQKWLLKLSVTGEFACFKPEVTWSTDNCLRRIFFPSLDGLSFNSIDFCLRNRFFALLGWNCCRMVDIFAFSFLIDAANRKFFTKQESSAQYFHGLLQSNNKFVVDVRQFYELYFLFSCQRKLFSEKSRDSEFSTHATRTQSKKSSRWEHEKITVCSTRAMPFYYWNIVSNNTFTPLQISGSVFYFVIIQSASFHWCVGCRASRRVATEVSSQSIHWLVSFPQLTFDDPFYWYANGS